MTEVVHDPAAFRRACEALRADGKSVGLVPTMGALHAGHLSLVEQARRQTDAVVVTVFVNPLQFGPGEDYQRYPRTLETDVQACEQRDVALVFAPARDAMYPSGFQTHVEVGTLIERLEGIHRPGHFRGVTTIVTKLFNLTGPCYAFFGRKDYQQLRIVQRMVRDLDMPIEVVGRPTVREQDGLALSSRNHYLSADQRERAQAIAHGLRAAASAWAQGERDADRLRSLAREPIDAAFDSIDYVAIVDPDELEMRTGPVADERAMIVVAAHLGSTRLIDNLELGVDPVP